MRFKLGVSPEEQIEKYNKEHQERIARIRLDSEERERKLGILLRRKKRDKILITTIFILLSIILIVFGTKNTFFREELSIDKVATIAQNVNRKFPVHGLENYIRTNFSTWLNKHISYTRTSESALSIDYVEGDLNSLEITEIREIDPQLARVYFSIDLITKQSDTEGKGRDGRENEIIEGFRDVRRYAFYVPIAYKYYQDDDGDTYAAGYVPVEPMSMYILETKHSSEVESSESYAFQGESEATDVVEAARLKVDKILDDMYRGKDTSQDLRMSLGFNTDIKAVYMGINDFKFHTRPNALGANAFVTYTIRTSEGFTYQNKHYLVIRKNGSTWTINGIL